MHGAIRGITFDPSIFLCMVLRLLGYRWCFTGNEQLIDMKSSGEER